MRYFLNIFCLLCLGFSAFGQNYNWAIRFGNTKSDKATAVKTDAFGNVYVAGYFSNTVTLGTNNIVLNFTANASSKEVFIAKFDSLGACLWAHSAGEGFDDRVLGMDVDSAGYATITGTFWETGGINFSGNMVSGVGFGGGDQGFVVTYDPAGNYVWGAFVCSDGGDDQGLDVAIDKAGNRYVVGFMSGDTLFVNGNTVKAGNANIPLNIQGWYNSNCFWLAKFNKAGTPQWARTFGRQPRDPNTGKYVERDIAVCVDDSGGVYIGGGFEKTTIFNNVIDSSTGGYDIFAIKYDSSGNHQWTQLGGSDKDDWVNGITYDEMGHIYLAGEHRDSLFYDSLIIRNYNRRDAFVMKVNASNGAGLWGKRMGGPLGSERANDVYADANCNVYVCGDIQAGGKFNDEIFVPNNNSLQAFVARMNPNGKFLWAATGGGPDSNDRCNSVIKGLNGRVYACGFFRTPATFGTSLLTSSGSSDAYVICINDSMVNASNSLQFTPPSDSIVCPGGTVFLALPKTDYMTISPQTAVVFNADSTVLSITPNATTTYTITGMLGENCPSYDTLIFSAIIAPLPQAIIEVNPSSAVLVDSIQVVATSNSIGATTFQWYYNGLADGTGNSTSHWYYFNNDDFNTFCYTLVATSGEGCKDTTEACTTLLRPERTEMPNAFTPNGDLTNDEFRPVFIYTDLSKIRSYSLQIFDRYGTEVFESVDPLRGWNGTYTGRAAEVGTYMYTLRYVDVQGKSQSFKGDISLIR
jgi:gliding motility-associated-like protein